MTNLPGDDDPIRDNRRRYEERRNLFLRHGYDIEAERAFVIAKARPISGRILEVGTGKGHLTVALAQEGVPFTSVDLAVEDQRIARLNLQYHGLAELVCLERADAEALSFADGSFDLVVTANVLHHLVKPRHVIGELIRVLAPGGRLIVSDFNARGLDVIARIHEGEGGRHDVGPGTLAEVRAWLAAAGCSVEEHPHQMQDTLVGGRPA